MTSPALGLSARLVDRLNPILVREVQQTMNGRAFFGTLAVALLGVLVVALNASGDARSGSDGFTTFVLALRLLAPIVLVAIPLVAFLSMRQEVTAGTIEHLLLSRLSPGAIVRGKVYAAAVQLLLFLAVFGPLIGMTYLLRGIDVPTIVQMLGLAALGGLVASSFAIMMGAFSRYAPIRALPFLVTAAGLVLGCTGVVGALEFVARDVASGVARAAATSVELTVLGLTWVPALAGVAVFCVVATASLAHPNENRSTVFRVLAVVLLVAVFAWLVWLDAHWRARWGRHSDLDDAAPGVAFALAFVLLPWVHFGVTEASLLSVRVRTRVPKHPLLAAASVPWLPGGGRALVFVVLLAALALVGATWIPRVFGEMEPDARDLQRAWLAWAYVVAYAGLLGFARRRFAATGLVTIRVRLLAIVGAGFLVLLPRIVDRLGDVRFRSWSSWDALFPPDAFDRFGRTGDGGVVTSVVVVAAAALALGLPAIGRGFAEVLAAAKARRSRAG